MKNSHKDNLNKNKGERAKWFVSIGITFLTLLIAFYLSNWSNYRNQLELAELSENTLLSDLSSTVDEHFFSLGEVPDFNCDNNSVFLFQMVDTNYTVDSKRICEIFGLDQNLSKATMNSLKSYVFFLKYKDQYINYLGKTFNVKLQTFKEYIDEGAHPNRVDEAHQDMEIARQDIYNGELKMNYFENRFKDNINSKLYLEKQISFSLSWVIVYLAFCLLLIFSAIKKDYY